MRAEIGSSSSLSLDVGRDSGHVFVLLAAILWGTTGTAQHFAPAGATPLTVGTLRLVIGGTALFVLAMTRGGVRWRWHPALLAAAIGSAAYQVTFFAGVARTGVAAGTLMAMGSAPVWAGLFEMLFLRLRPSSRWMWATLMAVIGSGLLVGSQGQVGIDWGGALLALAAGASFALYTVSHRALVEYLPGDVIAGLGLFGGGLLLVPVLVFGDVQWLAQPQGIAVALHLGLIATALAYFLYGRGLTTISAASATTLTLAEPVTASILGVAVLGERLTLAAAVGALLVFLGLAWLAGGERD